VFSIQRTQCPQKQSQLLVRQCHQTATKRSNCWQSDLRDKTASLPVIMYSTSPVPIPGKTFQTSYIMAINKTIKQKTPNSAILSISLTHWKHHKCAQNVHREPWHKHRDGDATDWWLQQSNVQAFSIRL